MPGGARRAAGGERGGSRPGALAATVLLLLTALPLVPGFAIDASAQGDTPENLIINPGFERYYHDPRSGDRPVYWYTVPSDPPAGVEMRHDDNVSHNASRSVSISLAGGDTEEAYWFQTQNTQGGATVPFGGWVRGDLTDGSSIVLRVKVHDENGGLLTTRTASIGGDTPQWTELRGEAFELPDGTARVRMECALVGVGTAWFDDVYVGTPTDMNNPPFVVSVPPLEAALGVEYTYQARGVDLEGDDVVFELERGPDGMAVTQEGLVSWVPTAVPDAAVKVVLRANDTGGGVSYQDFFVRVTEAQVQRPVLVYLYSDYDDPFNDGLSNERYDRLLPVLEALAADRPELSPSVAVLFSGADVRDMGPGRSGVVLNVSTAISSGWAEAGYNALHEPTYDTNPVLDPAYATWDWAERVSAVSDLLSRPRDPRTGEVLGMGLGGYLAVVDTLGEASAVAGVGSDGAQLHALDRYDEGSLQLGIADGPSPAGTLASMLAEDPNTPYGVYWQGGRLRLDLAGAGTGPLAAREGPAGIEGAMGGLDPRRVNVVPVLVMDRLTYCNASTLVSGEPVGTPTEWAYSHPGTPRLPFEAILPVEERMALYEATCATLTWLADEVLPSTGGRFLSNEGLTRMVDPGAGISVSGAELATAANDLLTRRTALRYPNWVGVSWGFCRGEYQYFSLADMYGLLVQSLAAYEAGSELPASLDLVPLAGPREAAPPSQSWNRQRLQTVVEEAARQLSGVTDDVWRVTPLAAVPATSSPGGVEVNAMEFLLLMAEAYLILYEGTATGDPLLTLYPTVQWPVTRLALAQDARATDAGDSWNLKPASSDLQQDTEAPTVRYVTPAQGSVGVPLATNVTVTFSERMDETLALEGNVLMSPGVAASLRWEYHKLVLDPMEDLADNTTYTVTVTRGLEDIAGNPLAAEVAWSFSTVGLENGPPSLLPWPDDPLVEVLENQTIRLGVLAEDDGPPPLRYSWRLDGLLVVGAAGDSLVYTPTFTDAGEHTVTVVVSDSGGPPATATFTWNVTVANVNIPPVLLGTEPPAGRVDLLEHEGTVPFSVRAEDPDEGVLVHHWTLDSVPVPGDQLSGGGSVYDMPLDFESAGDHELACRFEDSAGKGEDVSWHVVVEDVNRPPVLLSISPSLPPTIELGDSVTLAVNVSDPDGDDLLYSWYVGGVPAAATHVGTWEFVPVTEGSFSISVLVEDGRGGSAGAETSVNVLPQPQVSPDPEPSYLPWLLLLVAMGLIVLALAWPYLGWLSRPGGGDEP